MSRRAGGFTLTELLVVMAIIAVAAVSVAVPFARRHQDASLDVYLKEMTAYLRYLQYKSIESGSVYKLDRKNFDPGISVFVKKLGSTDFERTEDRYQKRLLSSRKFESVLDGSALYFFPDGRVTSGSLVVLKDDRTIAKIASRSAIGAFEVSVNES